VGLKLKFPKNLNLTNGYPNNNNKVKTKPLESGADIQKCYNCAGFDDASQNCPSELFFAIPGVVNRDFFNNSLSIVRITA
jgi:hypothetical protein